MEAGLAQIARVGGVARAGESVPLGEPLDFHRRPLRRLEELHVQRLFAEGRDDDIFLAGLDRGADGLLLRAPLLAVGLAHQPLVDRLVPGEGQRPLQAAVLERGQCLRIALGAAASQRRTRATICDTRLGVSLNSAAMAHCRSQPTSTRLKMS